jgi:RNA polymerase sigma-70 factor (ECF subfamily)
MSDEDLLAAYYNGDDQAFEMLFDRYLQRLRRFLGSMGCGYEAEQLALDALFRVARTRRGNARFDHSRGTSASAWIYFIARNVGLTYLEGQSHMPPMTSLEPGDDLFDVLAGAYAPQESAPDPQVGDLIRRCIRELPEQRRSALMLWMTEDLDIRGISDVLGLSYGATGRVLKEARDSLRNLMGESGFQLVSRGQRLPPQAVIVHVWPKAVLILCPTTR